MHGIDPATPAGEARALVYLSILLDGFQTVHGRNHRGDFAEMSREMKAHGDSLRRFLAIPANKARWENVRDHSYGDFEPGFITAVNDLIAFEENLAAASTSRSPSNDNPASARNWMNYAADVSRRAGQ